jgi:hypothetical protein
VRCVCKREWGEGGVEVEAVVEVPPPGTVVAPAAQVQGYACTGAAGYLDDSRLAREYDAVVPALRAAR